MDKNGKTHGFRDLEVSGNQLLLSFAAPVQRWIGLQSQMLVSRGQYGLNEERSILASARQALPNEDAKRLLLGVRYSALKTFCGGSLGTLASRSSADFSRQLLGGTSIQT